MWVADRDHALRQECKALRERIIPAGNSEAVGDEPFARTMKVMTEGMRTKTAAEADAAIAAARTCALHEYHEEAERARGDAAAVFAAEGMTHSLYRTLRKRPQATLTVPDRVGPILAAWRKPSGMNAERWTFPDDPTRRSLETAISTMPVTGP